MKLKSQFNDGDFVEYRDKIYQIKMAGITRSVIQGDGEKMTVSHSQLTLIGKQKSLPIEEID
jgi:hypothetical protein